MDLAYVLRTLWDRRGWAVAALGVACVAGLLVGFHVSLTPVSLKARSTQHGTAATKVLVDTVPTTLTNSAIDYEPLIIRAGVYAQLVSTSDVRNLVSRFAHVPNEQIVTNVPSNAAPVTNQPSPNRASGPSSRSKQIADERSSYKLEINVDETLPIISIAAQAPDQARAVRLANATSRALQRYIRQLKPSRVAERPVRIRRLGSAAGATAGGKTGLTLALAVALVFFALCSLIIIAVSRGSRRRRPGVQPVAPPGVPYISPPVGRRVGTSAEERRASRDVG